MSEPTNAQMAEQEDMALDAQIAAHLQEKYEQRMRDEAAIADDTEPDREPPEEFGTYASDGFRLTTVLSGDISPTPFAGARPVDEPLPEEDHETYR